MLSISKTRANNASRYYLELEHDEEKHTEWYGKGAHHLGLIGSVNPQIFTGLLNGCAPDGQRLYQKQFPGRIAGYDLTFSAPKSVSIMAVWKQVREMVVAHRRAVTETLEAIERGIGIRLTREKETIQAETGNLTTALFEHALSREQDPQLHTHSVVMNTTLYEEGWRSIDARSIFSTIKSWGLYYRQRLARFVQALGYTIRAWRDQWELDIVPESVIQLFSKRRRQINELTSEKPLTSRQHQYACLVTRPEKTYSSMSVLRSAWDLQYKAHLQQVELMKTHPLKSL